MFADPTQIYLRLKILSAANVFPAAISMKSHMCVFCLYNLVGGIPTLWKIWVRQLGWWHSQYMESHKIHVPNHQSAILTPHFGETMFNPKALACFFGDLRCSNPRLDWFKDLILTEEQQHTWLDINSWRFPKMGVPPKSFNKNWTSLVLKIETVVLRGSWPWKITEVNGHVMGKSKGIWRFPKMGLAQNHGYQYKNALIFGWFWVSLFSETIVSVHCHTGPGRISSGWWSP